MKKPKNKETKQQQKTKQTTKHQEHSVQAPTLFSLTFCPLFPPVGVSSQTSILYTLEALVYAQTSRSSTLVTTLTVGPGFVLNSGSEGKVRALPPTLSRQGGNKSLEAEPCWYLWGCQQDDGFKDSMQPGQGMWQHCLLLFLRCTPSLKITINSMLYFVRFLTISIEEKRLTTLLHDLVGFRFNFLVFGKISSSSFEIFFLHWRTLLFHRGWLWNKSIAHSSVFHVLKQGTKRSGPNGYNIRSC